MGKLTDDLVYRGIVDYHIAKTISQSKCLFNSPPPLNQSFQILEELAISAAFMEGQLCL